MYLARMGNLSWGLFILTGYEQFFMELYQYHNTSTIITSRQIDDICKSVGLKSKATYANYKKQCIFKGILTYTSKKHTYRIDGNRLARIVQYGNNKKRYNDMNFIISLLSSYKGKAFRTRKDIRNFIYEFIANTTSMVSANNILNQLISVRYIIYDCTRYIIGNNTSTPMNHNHTNKQKTKSIREIIKTYEIGMPKWVLGARLWKKGIFVSMTAIRRALCSS